MHKHMEKYDVPDAGGVQMVVGKPEMVEAEGRLKLARRQRGIVQADADWVDKPFDDWLAGLREGLPLPRSSVVDLGVGMALSLPIRDAIIVSMVAYQGKGASIVVDKPLLVGFASRPHDPENAACMGRLLAQAFEDETAVIDAERCGRGVDMLGAMAGVLPRGYMVQPLAVIAYITWWLGEDTAGEAAFKAVQLDSGCTLAAIVCSAVRHGIWPAWLHRGGACTQGIRPQRMNDIADGSGDCVT